MANEKRLIDANEAKRRIIAFATGLHSEVLTVDSIIMMLNQSDTVDAVEVDTVAEMLAYVHGDECACNFGCHDEWLSMVCDYAETECPHPKEPNGCWKQFVKHWGERKDND